MIPSTAARLTEVFYEMAPDGWWVSLYGYRTRTHVRRQWSWRRLRHIEVSYDVEDTARTELSERQHTKIALAGTTIEALTPSLTFHNLPRGVWDQIGIHAAPEGPTLLDILSEGRVRFSAEGDNTAVVSYLTFVMR